MENIDKGTRNLKGEFVFISYLSLLIRSFYRYNFVSIFPGNQQKLRRNMGNNNQRALCQQLWAENKYLVLSHSSNSYKDIRQYLKQEVVELSQVQEMIDRACQIPEHRGQACNAFQHIWGYFKKKASLDERKDYMLLLDRYRFGQASK